MLSLLTKSHNSIHIASPTGFTQYNPQLSMKTLFDTVHTCIQQNANFVSKVLKLLTT